ncbi:MAG TPA: Ppx/GppA family phosphatase [Sphingomicrobium sp.]|nr:Ppx/GppA family phosphatase [Sphingomicrobium sp.]
MAAKSFGPVGIIDIGSNSVRFVAYGGAARVPSSLFNEKTSAALGKGLQRGGELDDDAMNLTLEALARFRRLGREMGLKKLHTVATAAVRDASNGPAFLERITALGLKPRLLSGQEEAELSGLGVISGIPDAHGIVADLGGGSLELVRVARGTAGEGVSLPLGVLRIGAEPDLKALERSIGEAVKASRLKEAAKGNGLYLVGGSFRALALLDLKLLGHPLPIVHQHRIRRERLGELAEIGRSESVDTLKARTGLSPSRIATLTAAATLLEAMCEVLDPARVFVSAFGLREGLLYRDLDQKVQAQDPLLASALEVGDRLGRFGDHGALLNQWIDPLFPDEQPGLERLRLAACLLGDIGWNAHPDFRAERAVDLAIHGNWVGIDAHGRAMLGRTLCAAFGGDGGFSKQLVGLLKPSENERASAWGKAIRLAQRLSGGTEALLRRSSLSLSDNRVILTLHPRYRELASGAVERRLFQLAKALGRSPEIAFD